MFFINVIYSHRDIVAICDSELIDKKFEEGKFQLDVKETFYGKEKVSEDKAIKIMKKMQKEDATFNIVGKNSVNLALKNKIIEEDNIGKIQGIPFALVLL
jgi:uncharacterized protein